LTDHGSQVNLAKDPLAILPPQSGMVRFNWHKTAPPIDTLCHNVEVWPTPLSDTTRLEIHFQLLTTTYYRQNARRMHISRRAKMKNRLGQTRRRRHRVRDIPKVSRGRSMGSPIRQRGLGSVVSSQRGAPAQNEFGALWRMQEEKIHEILYFTCKLQCRNCHIYLQYIFIYRCVCSYTHKLHKCRKVWDIEVA